MLPACRFERLALAAIDFPESFPLVLHASGVNSSSLPTGEQFALLRPLPVMEGATERYQLLGDYHQFNTLRQNGEEAVDCQIFPASLPPSTWLSLLILLHQQAGTMSPIFQAWIAARACTLLDEKDQLALLGLMGIKSQLYKRNELLALLQLEPSAVLALHQGLLAYKSGKLLALLSRKDQQQVVRVLSAYRLGGSKQQKLLEMVTELVRRENRPAAELLAAWLPGAGAEANLPQKAQHLLEHLHRRCCPDREAAEKAFAEFVRSLQPPEGLTIEHALSFEDESLEVRLRFADAEALRHHWPILCSLVSAEQ